MCSCDTSPYAIDIVVNRPTNFLNANVKVLGELTAFNCLTVDCLVPRSKGYRGNTLFPAPICFGPGIDVAGNLFVQDSVYACKDMGFCGTAYGDLYKAKGEKITLDADVCVSRTLTVTGESFLNDNLFVQASSDICLQVDAVPVSREDASTYPIRFKTTNMGLSIDMAVSPTDADPSALSSSQNVFIGFFADSFMRGRIEGLRRADVAAAYDPNSVKYDPMLSVPPPVTRTAASFGWKDFNILESDTAFQLEQEEHIASLVCTVIDSVLGAIPILGGGPLNLVAATCNIILLITQIVRVSQRRVRYQVYWLSDCGTVYPPFAVPTITTPPPNFSPPLNERVSPALDPVDIPNISVPDVNVPPVEFDSRFGLLGVSYQTCAGDYAEYLKRAFPDEQLGMGDVVALRYDGSVTRQLRAGSVRALLVISANPAVVGNTPPEEHRHKYVPVAFLGQVPVRVRGQVRYGDYLVASQRNDGTAVAIAPEHIRTHHMRTYVGLAVGSIVPLQPDSSAERVQFIITVVGMPQDAFARALEHEAQRIDHALALLNSATTTTHHHQPLLLSGSGVGEEVARVDVGGDNVGGDNARNEPYYCPTNCTHALLKSRQFRRVSSFYKSVLRQKAPCSSADEAKDIVIDMVHSHVVPDMVDFVGADSAKAYGITTDGLKELWSVEKLTTVLDKHLKKAK